MQLQQVQKNPNRKSIENKVKIHQKVLKVNRVQFTFNKTIINQSIRLLRVIKLNNKKSK